jgi:hypothetical protein
MDRRDGVSGRDGGAPERRDRWRLWGKGNGGDGCGVQGEGRGDGELCLFIAGVVLPAEKLRPFLKPLG